ncbi:hypothetical protein [Sphingomonas sp. Leaf343]|uniref:hypothetical protein n=1 Tax=Sphingomonas sp. Leaf343 TaxID=1736345 RepID=UPI0006F88576|nr:hypothetical protein [Sphingomonas sp. Leaf343]KQR83462.1 hypothetical protein ASG07_06965 [Sphingomonas sp. Leaf343]
MSAHDAEEIGDVGRQVVDDLDRKRRRSLPISWARASMTACASATLSKKPSAGCTVPSIAPGYRAAIAASDHVATTASRDAAAISA